MTAPSQDETAAQGQPAPVDLTAQKKQMRQRAKAQRTEAAARTPNGGPAIADHVLTRVPMPGGSVVSGFWPLPGELDTRPLLEALHHAGHQVVLPVMKGSGQPLIFRAWQPGDLLCPAGFGTLEPSPDKEELSPGVLMVPLLAFDRFGYRLGYGGGFYDRTLAGLRVNGAVLAVGIAYAGQEMDRVPREATDQPLDWMVTEKGARQI